MIIDSHTYCFEPGNSARGYSSTKEHLNWIQSAHAQHHQPAIRLKDRKVGSSEMLANSMDRNLDNLPSVDFGIQQQEGRVIWNSGEEKYTEYFYPPNIRNCEFTPHSLISEMDYAGIDLALIHTDPMLVRDCAYLSECIELYPDRLRAMAPVEEWRIINETDSVITQVSQAIEKHKLHAIKFNPFGYKISNEPWDDGPYRPFWEAISNLNIPVFFTLGSGPSDFRLSSIKQKRIGYLQQLRVLIAWMERYPDTVCSLTHGFPWRLFMDDNRIAIPTEFWDPFMGDNCNLEVCFPVRIGDLYDFPYKEVWPVLEIMVEKIGSKHLLWGSDMPFQNRFCTYKQSRQWIEKYCTFLSQKDISMIMGGTATRLLSL